MGSTDLHSPSWPEECDPKVYTLPSPAQSNQRYTSTLTRQHNCVKQARFDVPDVEHVVEIIAQRERNWNRAAFEVAQPKLALVI